MRVIRWLPDTCPSLVSGLNAWTVVYVFVAHEEDLVTVDQTSHVGTIPNWLASYFLVCDLPLLFVYFQVNNGVLYVLKIYTSWVSHFNP